MRAARGLRRLEAIVGREATPRETVALGAERATPIAAKVAVVSGPDEGREVALDAVVDCGTDASCQLVLHDTAVSRRHVSIRSVAGRIVVKDLGSRNGTFLGEARVAEIDVPLGAVLRIGKSTIAIQPRWHVREVAPSEARAFGDLVGESVGMREIFALLERVAASQVTVLVEGESGTGKELVARSIHKASPRAGRPYVVFDCGSVPSELAESELFGHKKGSFSGAIANRAGAFQQAHGGTLFLDELGELPLDIQPKLLRVLEEGEVKAVGDDSVVKVDVRVVAATNRDLHAEARRGRFRSDLLYRLEVVRLRMPPLRSRPEDIPVLLSRLLAGKLPEGDRIEGPNLDKLMAYGWPGNVRELRNVLTRSLALSARPGGPPPTFANLVINLGPASSTPATIGADFPGTSSRIPYKQAKSQLLQSFDRAYLSAILERHRGNVSAAAAEAGLSRKHMYELMRRVEEASDSD
jgi:DNA-binding NtrC family response regulator